MGMRQVGCSSPANLQVVLADKSRHPIVLQSWTSNVVNGVEILMATGHPHASQLKAKILALIPLFPFYPLINVQRVDKVNFGG